MKNSWLIWAGLGLLVILFLKKKGTAATPVEIGRIESASTTESDVVEILQQAVDFSRSNEPAEVTRLRNDIKNSGAFIRSCSLNGTEKWCTLSNGWVLPSWLTLEYLGLNEPPAPH